MHITFFLFLLISTTIASVPSIPSKPTVKKSLPGELKVTWVSSTSDLPILRYKITSIPPTKSYVVSGSTNEIYFTDLITDLEPGYSFVVAANNQDGYSLSSPPSLPVVPSATVVADAGVPICDLSDDGDTFTITSSSHKLVVAWNGIMPLCSFSDEDNSGTTNIQVENSHIIVSPSSSSSSLNVYQEGDGGDPQYAYKFKSKIYQAIGCSEGETGTPTVTRCYVVSGGTFNNKEWVEDFDVRITDDTNIIGDLLIRRAADGLEALLNPKGLLAILSTTEAPTVLDVTGKIVVGGTIIGNSLTLKGSNLVVLKSGLISANDKGFGNLGRERTEINLRDGINRGPGTGGPTPPIEGVASKEIMNLFAYRGYTMHNTYPKLWNAQYCEAVFDYSQKYSNTMRGVGHGGIAGDFFRTLQTTIQGKQWLETGQGDWSNANSPATSESKNGMAYGDYRQPSRLVELFFVVLIEHVTLTFSFFFFLFSSSLQGGDLVVGKG